MLNAIESYCEIKINKVNNMLYALYDKNVVAVISDSFLTKFKGCLHFKRLVIGTYLCDRRYAEKKTTKQ